MQAGVQLGVRGWQRTCVLLSVAETAEITQQRKHRRHNLGRAWVEVERDLGRKMGVEEKSWSDKHALAEAAVLFLNFCY